MVHDDAQHAERPKFTDEQLTASENGWVATIMPAGTRGGGREPDALTNVALIPANWLRCIEKVHNLGHTLPRDAMVSVLPQEGHSQRLVGS
ncbi:MAG: hypothetical protein ACR2JC_17385 [Chloroflexota bacterium]|nr:MAG: hypothetical protein DLM70_03955 [Chloroflexota bacterium]